MIELYYVGRFVIRGKRVHLLKELTEILDQNSLAYEMKIFSDLDLNSIEYKMFKDNPNFSFLGFVPDWYKSVSENAIMLFVTQYEGCPLSILEAYKHGRNKLLMLKIPGIVNYVSDNCLVETIPQMSEKIINHCDLTNHLNLAPFFDPSRFKLDVDNIFAKI